MHHATIKPARSRLHTLFAPREFSWRTDGGKQRSIALSTRKQMVLAGVCGAVATAWIASVGALAMGRAQTVEQQALVAEREALVSGEAATVARWQAEVDRVAADLSQRQELLESVAGMLPADAVADQEAAAAADLSEASGRAQRIGAALPQGAALLKLEQRQLALAARLTRYAETRADRAEGAIRALGVDPRTVRAGRNDQLAMGGPLEAFSSGADGALSPRFERLGASLTRMAELEQSMARVPQVMPVAGARFSSSFGYRRDPFHGTAALHAGLDFAAPMGSPVLAAADGRVTFVGTKGGYGRTVEVTHGNGMMTRYGHLSGWKAKVGDRVKAGDQVAMLGSTGRSTGPHLHFEVRVHGRAVNPLPFLRNAPALLADARGE
ncbi:M23 family metallopeptidase [Croceibacterium sp. TMG7-5b_MA50]|uniref:M23 family metallopeptidase n=1 Tax=Croceibacterium sp. TMG7-5b_MA50 TaxID=3121290 RepID=UPI003221B82F